MAEAAPTERVHLRVSPDTALKMRLGAEAEGVSRSEFVERAVALYAEVCQGRRVEAPLAMAVGTLTTDLAQWAADTARSHAAVVAASRANVACLRFIGGVFGVDPETSEEVREALADLERTVMEGKGEDRG